MNLQQQSILRLFIPKSVIPMLRTSPNIRQIRDLVVNLKSINRTPLKELQKYFEAHEIEYVLDIGANIGQFGIDLRRSGFKGEIISFEPDPENFLLLNRRVKSDSKWSAYDFALGANEGFASLKISANDGLSSSFLEMSPLHLSSFPESKIVSEQEVRMSTLDLEIGKLNIDLKRTVIKMDVQGYESQILEGGRATFKEVQASYFESSLVMLYKGERLFSKLISEFGEYGLSPVRIFPGITNSQGEMLQVDTLVARTSV